MVGSAINLNINRKKPNFDGIGKVLNTAGEIANEQGFNKAGTVLNTAGNIVNALSQPTTTNNNQQSTNQTPNIQPNQSKEQPVSYGYPSNPQQTNNQNSFGNQPVNYGFIPNQGYPQQNTFQGNNQFNQNNSFNQQPGNFGYTPNQGIPQQNNGSFQGNNQQQNNSLNIPNNNLGYNTNQNQPNSLQQLNNNLPTYIDNSVKWSAYFKDPQNRPTCNASAAESLNKNEEEQSIYLDYKIPQIKPDIHTSTKYGYDQAAYLFDNLDNCFKQTVVNAFTKTYNEAKAKIPQNPQVDNDPYSLANQLRGYLSLGMESKIDQEGLQRNDINSMYQSMKRIKPNFNQEAFEAGITMPALDAILAEWNWPEPKYTKADHMSYYIFNKYDFDGNGRLDPREFILLSILHNQSQFGVKSTSTNAYQDVIWNILDPFFSFADCDSDGLMSAENFWHSTEQLKCRGNQYNIFVCDAFPENPDIYYRSSSVNDFILKNEASFKGRVSFTEFVKGFLLGFWDRQVSSTKIDISDIQNMKNLRWSPDGSKDLGCQEIKKARSVK